MTDAIIRKLTKEDWESLREIRLKALEEHPGNFSARLDDVSSKNESYWHDLLDSKGKCIFGLFEGANLIGISSIFDEGFYDGRKFGSLHMSYIKPDYRNRHLSRLFYEARIKWAREHEIQSLHVSHRENNEASRKAIERQGFYRIKQEIIEWPDGRKAMDYIYRLDL